jgi:hypothetical protein
MPGGLVLERLAEMAEVGEAVCVDGWRPGAAARRLGNQKVLYDAGRHAHTARA